ncbi:MAG: choice-of-anchor D domain-containing protein, partial [Burkholderiaceae bacterium]|nr:choice-of-anchor D domain-containing protein [Burkholderiaceae bacterium]
ITVNTAGVYTPLNGQAVSIVNNFENTRSQVLTISSAAGAAAYNLAEAAAVAPNPVNLANQRVGGTNAGALTIANVAPTGLFTEALNASFGSLTGDALTNGGAVNLLAAGSSDSTAMTVRLDGTTAGAKTGSVQIDFASDGTGSSGLGLTSLPTQTVTVNGSFFNSAVGDTTPTPVVIANQRVGGSTSQVLTVANTAAAGLFSEALNASFGANTGAVTNNAGSVSDLIAGGSDNAAMSAGLDTTTAGAKSGSVTLDYQSDGTGTNGNSGLAAIAAGSQVINVSGNVYNAAVGSTSPSPVVIASQRVGGSASQALTVSNAAAAGLFSEALNASFGANTGDATNNAGSLTDLIAGGSDNAAMSVGIDTTTAGAKSGSVTLDYQSDGTGTNGNSGLAAIAAGAQVVNVSGNVYAPAAAQLNTTAVNFGIVHVGDVVANRNVSVSSAAPVSSLNDVLTGSISGAASPFSSSGTLGTGVAAGDTDAASLQVGLDTSNAGVFNSNASVSFASHNDEMADVDLGNQDVTLTGQVNNFAQAEFAQTGGQGSFSGAGANYTLDFGTLVAGDAGLSAQLAVLNTAVGPADALRGSFDLGTVGVGDNFTLSGFATFADVAAGGSFSGLSISFDSGLIGSVDKVIVLSSAGTNASGFDAALGDIELRLRGTVVAIPEPGTYLMLIAGLLVLVSVRRFQGAR